MSLITLAKCLSREASLTKKESYSATAQKVAFTTRNLGDDPIVTVSEGKLRGITGVNLDGGKFYKFFSIPYARPPLDELRFKPPQPAEPWEGVRDATKYLNASLSRDEISKEIIGSEDCLHLNVFTRVLPSSSTQLRPVMVYIHGGGLIFGSSAPGLYGAEFLMIKDIVIVTMNYRLGVLGFLSADDTEVYGNMGLKDQNMALKWVQSNIRAFNGDPNNVTIFGESAGSGSVHAHILSSASKGLFHKAILQSATILCPWFWGQKNNARQLAPYFGKTANTDKEALEILMQVPGLDLYNAQESIPDSILPFSKRPFGAVVETPNETAFLTKDPRDIIREGSYNKVPMMMGYTDTEGMLLKFKQTFTQGSQYEMEKFIPYELNVTDGSDKRKEIASKLEAFYTKPLRSKYCDAATDSCFLIAIIETLLGHLRTTKNPIYLYRISLSTNLNRFKAMINKLDEPGTSHADDLGYLWQSDITPEIRPQSVEDKSIRTFVELWTNFAEFGNPTPNNKLNILWPAIESEENLKLLEIGETLQVKEVPERERLQMWSSIFKESLPKCLF